MLYTEGNLTSEDAALRRIARSKLHSALHSLETKSQSLVDTLVNKLSATSNRNLTADQLLTLVEQHPQLRPERAIIRRYVDAFPELADAVSVSRDRIQTRARRRIESALAPAEFARRFRFTRGLCC